MANFCFECASGKDSEYKKSLEYSKAAQSLPG